MKKFTISLLLLFFTFQVIGQTLIIEPQNVSICPGNSAVLYVKGGGSNFTWSPSTCLSATTGDSVVLSYNLGDNSQTVTYTVTGLDSTGQNATGYDTVSFLSAFNKPIITVNYDTLVSNVTQGIQWYVNNSIINGAINSTYIANTNDFYYVTATNIANGCSSYSDTIYLLGFLQIPTWEPTCVGGSVVLTAPNSGSNYIWSPSTGLNTTTGDTVIASPTVTTTYYITGLDSAGKNYYEIGTDVLTVNPTPNKPLIIDSGNILISSATTGNQWYMYGTPINGATHKTFTLTADTGCYWDVVTNISNGCNTSSDTICLAIEGINRLSLNGNQISIYPNPTSGQFTIKLNGNQNESMAEVYNVVGEMVYQSALSNSQDIIDLNSQPAGMYFVYLKSSEGVKIGKVLVSK